MHALSVRVEQAGNIFDGRYGCSKRVVPRIMIVLFVPECRRLCSGLFLCAGRGSGTGAKIRRCGTGNSISRYKPPEELRTDALAAGNPLPELGIVSADAELE